MNMQSREEDFADIDVFLNQMQALSSIYQHKALKTSFIKTPLGSMIAIADEKALFLLEFLKSKGLESNILRLQKATQSCLDEGRTAITIMAEQELEAYFHGKLTRFSTPVHFTGTAFQEKVWHALTQIPYAETRSYSEQAGLIGHPSSCRAVANANGANPLAILVPCHRIINHDGKLGGYAGGIERKTWLLQHEKLHQPKD